MTMVSTRTMTVGTTNYMHMFFSKCFIEKTGCKTLILCNFLVAHRADSFYAWLTAGIAVRAAHNNHKLVGNIHGAVNF